MSAMALRPYQRQAVEAVEREWWGAEKRRSTILVMATGTGKTVVMATLAKRAVEAGGRVLLLAHRGELLEQARDKFRSLGLETALEKAGDKAWRGEASAVIGSVQTMANDNRLRRWEPGAFTHVFVDECHHSTGGSYTKILEHFGAAKVLGVTATPRRADKAKLSEVYDSLAFEYGMRDAVADGYLVPLKAFMSPLEIDVSKVKVTAGDLNGGQLGAAIEPYLEAIAREMVEHCLGKRRTAVFLPLVATSEKMCRILNSYGFRAVHVDGSSEDRKEMIGAFARGKFDVICNSLLLTEGWDCPPVDCIVNLRATKSEALYTQIVGRGTRLSPETGKTDLLLLDFLWQTGKLKLCRPANIFADDDEVADRMEQMMLGEEVDLMAGEEKARRDVEAERNAKLASDLDKQRRSKKKLVDPLQYEASIGASDLIGWRPSKLWEHRPVSDKQASCLEKLGIDPSTVENAGKASLLIDRAKQRIGAGLATARQIRCLERYGFTEVGTWSFGAANAMISRIAANGWRLPRGVNAPGYRP